MFESSQSQRGAFKRSSTVENEPRTNQKVPVRRIYSTDDTMTQPRHSNKSKTLSIADHIQMSGVANYCDATETTCSASSSTLEDPADASRSMSPPPRSLLGAVRGMEGFKGNCSFRAKKLLLDEDESSTMEDASNMSAVSGGMVELGLSRRNDTMRRISSHQAIPRL